MCVFYFNVTATTESYTYGHPLSLHAALPIYGLRAVFQLESGYDSSTVKSAQGGRLFGRQATIGLQSDSWGRLDFGRQTNIASKYFGSIDPFGAGFGQANIDVGLSAANTQRYDNMIMRSEEHTSELQSLMRISYAVFCLKKKKQATNMQ